MSGFGMLWYDPSVKPLADKLAAAAAYFAEKYGARPTLAHVHPSQAESESAAGLQVKPNRSIQPNHFWLGTDS